MVDGIVLVARRDPRWQRLLASQPSCVFHSPAWLGVLADTYGFTVEAHLLVDERGEPQAGIPVCRVEDLRGQRLVALSFSDFCDPLATTPTQWRILADRLLAEGQPIIVRPLHNELPLADERFTRFNRARWHGLDLRPPVENLWQALHESARRAVRKAQQAGVVVRIAADQADLRAFFDLHLHTRRAKYRMLAQPYRFFENIWHNFIEQGAGVLMVAEHQGDIIGATLYLEWQKTFVYKFNTSQPNRLALRPNDLLIWCGIEYAKAKDFTRLDFGLSDWDQEGLIRYKAKFATQEKTISFLRYTPDSSISPHDQEMRRLLGQLTTVLTDDETPNGLVEKAVISSTGISPRPP
jgi:CelD/BcsL family acetyltransferase involved in cellulose biosynthesis